jgi:hypothetical protein
LEKTVLTCSFPKHKSARVATQDAATFWVRFEESRNENGLVVCPRVAETLVWTYGQSYEICVDVINRGKQTASIENALFALSRHDPRVYAWATGSMPRSLAPGESTAVKLHVIFPPGTGNRTHGFRLEQVTGRRRENVMMNMLLNAM